MADRLGDVLYWGFCALAFLLAAGAFWIFKQAGNGDVGFAVFVFSPAALMWMIGLALRYVLKG